MSLKRMFKEEWRMHSRIYSGRSFAMFPVLVFFLTASFTYGIETYSTVSASALNGFLPVFGLFLGLGVGAVGFSSKDAFKNILGRTNYIMYSSRTLPVSSKKLLAQFIFKDLIYYSAFFIAPVLAGIYIISGFSIASLNVFPAFVLGITVSILVTRSSLRAPSVFKPSYGNGLPLVQKSLLDLMRSSGGLLKIVFSLTVLSGFYWFLVLNFPLAEVFLQQPMISFSALIGTISITVYNWINRFDEAKDYMYLPVNNADIIEAKQKAFVRITFPLVSVLSLAPVFFYSGNILVSVITALSTSTFALGAASLVFLLKPNTRIYSSKHFSKLIALNSLAIVPLILAAVFGVSDYLIMLMNGIVSTAGLQMIMLARDSVQEQISRQSQ